MPNIVSSCACAFVGFSNFSFRGDGCQAINGTLASGDNYKPGDFVKWNTNKYERIAVGDTLSATDRIGVIRVLKSYPDGAVQNAANIDGTNLTVDFKFAQIWGSGSETQIPCKEVYLKSGSNRVAFAPETHTSLAARLKIQKVNNADGTGVVNYFTF